MYPTPSFLSVLTIVSAVIAAPLTVDCQTGNSISCTSDWKTDSVKTPAVQKGPKAIYFISNNPAGNSIIAMKVGADGTLSEGSSTPTGGKGASAIDGMTNQTAGPDALFSQSALKVEGHMLIAVNPGSNTMTLMAIDAANPTKLTMIGQPVDTMGEFPVTAAISTKNKMACVGNTGAKAGIACFSMSARKGLKPLMKSQIAFDIKQTTPPVGPANTVSQVLFNSDESMLLTTVKGDPMKNATGFLSMLPIHKDCPATQDTRSSPAGTAVLFGSAVIPGTTDIFATDASFGAATISITGTPTVLKKATIDGQGATCWAAISPLTNTAFVTDVLVNNLVEIDPNDGKILQNTPLALATPGMIDLVAGGQMVYVLNPGNGTAAASVAVMDVSNRPAKMVQNFEAKGGLKDSQGLTAFM
ncbi:MAG: hypothetical protein Q9170_004798 [Blastenia crenularia]